MKALSPWRPAILRALPYVACVTPLALYQALYVNGFYPITEGWFSEYAHLMRGGAVPYRDFSLLLMPLYPLQISGFQSIFGEGIWPLHVLGIVVTCAIAIALLDILRNFFNPWVCAFAAAVGTVYYESGNAFLGYDFTQFVTLYLLIATALLIRSIVPDRARGANPATLWLCGGCGVFLALALLIKQSNGGIADLVLGLTGVIAGLVLYGLRGAFLRFTALAAGFCLPLSATLLWLAGNGAIAPFFADVFAGAAKAKGGLNVFTWAHYFFNPITFVPTARQAGAYFEHLLLSMIIIAAILEAVSLIRNHGWLERSQVFAALLRILGLSSRPAPVQALFLAIVGLGALSALIIAVAYHHCAACNATRWLGDFVIYSTYIWSVNFYLAGFAATVVILVATKRLGPARFFIVTALGVGLTFGNGASSGLSEISAFLGMAVLLAFLVNAWARYVVPALLPVVIALSFCGVLVENKFAAPYAWWQVSTPPVRSIGCAPATGVLAGLCMTPTEYSSIVRIQNAILANSSPRQPIYVYPHMPIFYLLTNRQPFDGAVVSWFDFTSDQLADDLSRRLRVDPPSVIVMAEIPQSVLTAHEQLFRNGKPLGQRKILATISALRARGVIRRVERIGNLNNLAVVVYRRVNR